MGVGNLPGRGSSLLGVVWLVVASLPGSASGDEPRPQDLTAFRWTPHDGERTSKAFVRARLRQTLGSRALRHHAAHRVRRQLGLAYAARHGGSLGGLDLERLLAADGRGAVQAVRQVLTRVEARPAATWLSSLRREGRAAADPAVRRALVKVRNAIGHEELAATGETLRTMLGRLGDRAEQRLTDRLWRRHAGLGRLNLPAALPPLPTAAVNPRLASITGRATRLGSAEQRYLYLERQATWLRGSSDRGEQRLGEQLTGYLKRYKRSWATGWLDGLTHRFAGQPPVGWSLLGGSRFGEQLTSAQRATMSARLTEAWQIISGLVSPKLLERIPPVKVRIGMDPFTVPGIVNDGGNKVITLLPDSSVKDILHEFGHQIEYFGGLGTFASAHAIRARRSTGARLKPLSQLLPNTSYGPRHQGYEGGYLEPYMGRYYADGYTEIVSMGLERFATKQGLRELFDRDGAYLLTLVKTLQSPHDYQHRRSSSHDPRITTTHPLPRPLPAGGR